MSAVIGKAMEILAQKFAESGFDSIVTFDIEDEGQVTVDGTQSPPAVSEGAGEAALTITASQEVFDQMMSGDLNPTTAYMSGQLKIDGDLGLAMKLASTLA